LVEKVLLIYKTFSTIFINDCIIHVLVCLTLTYFLYGDYTFIIILEGYAMLQTKSLQSYNDFKTSNINWTIQV